MTPHHTLTALAVRCEAAMGADRELDAEIARTLGLQGSYLADSMGWDDVGHAIYKAGPQRYTASLDAALLLVPVDGWWQFSSHTGTCLVAVGTDKRPNWANAATPALALTAAALRARAAIAEAQG